MPPIKKCHSYVIFVPLGNYFYFTHVSFETINKLKLFFECDIPMPQDAGTLLLSLLQICIL
jgi:hypothetical protein